MVYITGSGQSQATSDRVKVYETEGNVHPIKRQSRKNISKPEQKVEFGVGKRFVMQSFDEYEQSQKPLITGNIDLEKQRDSVEDVVAVVGPLEGTVIGIFCEWSNANSYIDNLDLCGCCNVREKMWRWYFTWKNGEYAAGS